MSALKEGQHYIPAAIEELNRALALDAPKERRAILLYSCALAFSFALAFWLDGMRATEAAFLTAAYCLAFFLLLCPMVKFVARHGEPWRNDAFDKRLFWMVFAAIFAVYFLQFLINFPGCCTPDSDESIKTALGINPRELSNWTPVFYTAFVAPFMWIGEAAGSIAMGVALYSLTQMALLSGALAYAIAWLARRGAPRILVLLAALFFIFDPVTARYSITMWKDIPFSICMLLYVLCLGDIVLEKGNAGRGVILKLTLLSLGVGLFRNNGLYIVFVTLVVLVVVYRKTFLKKYLSVAVGVLLTILLMLGPVYDAIGVAPSPFRESVGIPLQQVGAVVCRDGDMTEEQKEFLSGMMPLEQMKDNYTSTSSDGLKFSGYFNDDWMESNKTQFMKTWIELGVQNPIVYFEAWMNSTRGYWNANTSDWAVASSGYLDNPGTSILYELTGMECFERDGEGDFEELRLSHTPLYLLYSIGASVWLMIACVFVAFRHSRTLLIPLMPLVLLWATLMIAAPAHCQLRYMFSLHLAIPFMVAVIFASYGALRKKSPRCCD